MGASRSSFPLSSWKLELELSVDGSGGRERADYCNDSPPGRCDLFRVGLSHLLRCAFGLAIKRTPIAAPLPHHVRRNMLQHGVTRSLIREQISIAADARDAAWVVAHAARRANTRATIALVIASISALVAVAAVVVPHFWRPFNIPRFVIAVIGPQSGKLCNHHPLHFRASTRAEYRPVGGAQVENVVWAVSCPPSLACDSLQILSFHRGM
jgi:hypothetical protein